MQIDETNIMTIRLTLAEIADQLGRSTSWLRDIRNRDRRWPSADADGRYSLVAVLTLLDLRECERMTDEQFDQERRDNARETLSRIEVDGDGTGVMITRWAKEVLAGQHDGQRRQWIDERLLDLAECLRPTNTHSHGAVAGRCKKRQANGL